ncbi:MULTISPECIES: hypothetical protein [unclassified Devosia]|uniref:hypothetical protein n=1 Tax=unclassified Devosia TaxID=196773 RepID=UPI00145F0499|nr:MULTISPECIES: hypothetical protein [unclassified Devosia]MBJ6987622.1 hypothetical protein [Devosia sp. MC521]MBK1795323.1 hypothetical protein [Devosia sp. WQ 349K1]QMW62309.1 hypothetical protein H4N61_15470 [Devosia sp. MC521]
MLHRYKVGDLLDMRTDLRRSNRPAGTCEVLTCLPHEKGPLMYRVKSVSERNERVMEEADLSPSDSAKSLHEANESIFSIAVSKR